MNPEYKEFLADAESSIEYWAQTAILDFTEEIARLMDELEVSRSELARRIDTSPAYITKVLRGNANFTLATMTKLARALDSVVRIHLSPEGVVVHWEDRYVSRNEKTDITFAEGEVKTSNVKLYPNNRRVSGQQVVAV